MSTLVWTPFVDAAKEDGAEEDGGRATRIEQQGTYVRLISDVADEEMLADLVTSFDQAVPQWMAFWNQPMDRIAQWKIDACLMRDIDLFRESRDLPAAVPRFEFGFASPHRIWIRLQETPHYNRHLFLHEGVHALAIHLFGGGGPSWYMEGTAELLSTHRERPTLRKSQVPGQLLLAQSNDVLRVNQIPRDRSEAPLWGRFRVIRERRDAGTIPSLGSVLKLPMNLAGDVESYTWCWVAAMMMTRYPDTRATFVRAADAGVDQSPAFTSKFYRQIQDQWPVLRARWAMLTHDLQFGFTFESNLIDVSTDDPRFDGRGLTRQVRANAGWQSVGVWFPGKTKFHISATGTCTIVAKDSHSLKPGLEHGDQYEPQDWVSAPGGISAAVHRGAPLGSLEVCILPIPKGRQAYLPKLKISRPVSSDWRSVARWPSRGGSGESMVGSIYEIEQPSWVLMRINDMPGDRGQWQRADNLGHYDVALEPIR